MAHPRITKLAATLLNHSLKLKAGEKVLIEAFDLPDSELVCELVEQAAALGGQPVVTLKDNSVLRSLYRSGTADQLQLIGELEAERMRRMDCYIGIRGAANSSELVDVPQEQMDLFSQHWFKPVHLGVRVPHTRWVVLRYPTPSMAQAANMSQRAFEDYFFSVCTADYAAMAENLKPLHTRMNATDRVHIQSPGTDLKFSIKDIPTIPCTGECNIPDGEIFTAPVRESVNGTIAFNTGSRYMGTIFQGIQFTFKDGKIIEATCDNEHEKLNHILDTDEGARYIGEWSLGTNNAVKTPMLDTLFDEKIGGSFHLTPGNAYDEADNGNKSAVHWDLVLIQTKACGGGTIRFDDELIRQDGHFVPEDLQPLNAGLV